MTAGERLDRTALPAVPEPDAAEVLTPVDPTPADEAARLRLCADEPIHRPGAIQPHGVLLALDDAAHVVQVSANVADMLGATTDEVLGRPLHALLDPLDADAVLTALRSDHGDPSNAVAVHLAGRAYDAVVHRSPDGPAVVELEPADGAVPASDDRWLPELHASIQRISRTTDVAALRQEAARAVRRLTGFDRVMVYHFHPDEHGEVVAEDRADHLEPYLGLHYPASDIPPQARRLYLQRLSRTIPAREYVPADLVPPLHPGTAAPTDLSRSELRSVSPHHLQFLRNMGVGATFSVSLVHDGRLVGMISCNHGSPRHIPYRLRRGCEILGQQVALQVRALTETRRLERRLELQAVRSLLVEQLARGDDAASALATGDVSVLDVLPADGALVRLDGRTVTVGSTPDEAAVAAAAEHLRATSARGVATAALPVDHPELAALLPGVAGLVLTLVGDDGDHLAWFRPAIAQTVEWLGDQSPANRATPLSPRNSFHRWRETVTDRAEPWDDVEVAETSAVRDLAVRHLAQLRARRAAARAALTARVTSQLAETLDAEEAVARLARLVVPELADWCIVSLVDSDHPGGRRVLRDVGWSHADPARRPLVEAYARVRQDAVGADSLLGRALESGRTVAVPHGAAAAARAVLVTDEARDLVDRLAPEAGAVLPLRARNRTVGLITLYTETGRGIPQDALTTAQEVAGRAGMALDNARLYRQQQLLAEGLQRSLLTEPPRSEHLQIAVRYTPAAEAAKVGGDWYDAFALPDGGTSVVIGDVVGHDIIAAAAMGQLRSLVRGIAVTTDAGPAEVLRRVDHAIDVLRAETIATAVVARVAPPGPDGTARLRWSNAGHPAPMVVGSDGRVRPLAGVPGTHADLVLGVLPGTDRQEHEVLLEPGTTVLLYTDGLVERRREPLHVGLARLEATLAALPTHDLEGLCDEVLTRMLPARPDDDVALVAVRLAG